MNLDFARRGAHRQSRTVRTEIQRGPMHRAGGETRYRLRRLDAPDLTRPIRAPGNVSAIRTEARVRRWACGRCGWQRQQVLTVPQQVDDQPPGRPFPQEYTLEATVEIQVGHL